MKIEFGLFEIRLVKGEKVTHPAWKNKKTVGGGPNVGGRRRQQRWTVVERVL